MQKCGSHVFREVSAQDIFENFADNEEEAVEEEIEIRDILLIKVAQNQILNIFYQKKSFEFSLLVRPPTTSSSSSS